MSRVLLACAALALLAGCQSASASTWGGGSKAAGLHVPSPAPQNPHFGTLPKATDPEVQADVARAKAHSTCPDIPLTKSQLDQARAGDLITCTGSGSGTGASSTSTTSTVKTPITLTNADVSAQTSVVVTSTGSPKVTTTKRKVACSRPVFGRCPLG